MNNFELTNEFLDSIKSAIETKSMTFLEEELSELYSADIASILYELDGEEAHFVFQFLDTEKGADVLSSIDTDDRKRFIKEQFTVEEIAKYVNLFDSDDAFRVDRVWFVIGRLLVFSVVSLFFYSGLPSGQNVG